MKTFLVWNGDVCHLTSSPLSLIGESSEVLMCWQFKFIFFRIFYDSKRSQFKIQESSPSDTPQLGEQTNIVRRILWM